MGALKGSIAVRRYAVLEPLPAGDARQKLTRGAKAHAFVPVDPRSDVDRSLGWVSILDNGDAELRQDKLFFVASGGEQLRVTLRIETLRPPAAEVRRQLASRVAAMAADQGRPPSRHEKSVLKAEIVQKLKLRSFPQVRVIDLVWDLDARRMYFWSQAKGTNGLFLDHFAKSFGLRIEVEGPARWARAAAAAPVLAKLEPTPELWIGFTGLRPLSGIAGEDA